MIQIIWPDVDALQAYLLGYFKVSILLLVAYALLRSAPAAWRFRLAITGLAVGLVPWHEWLGWNLSIRVVPEWIAPVMTGADFVAPEPVAVVSAPALYSISLWGFDSIGILFARSRPRRANRRYAEVDYTKSFRIAGTGEY